MSEITDLVALSRHAGMRFDLVQAGGGNTSVKTDDGELQVKASGINLSQMTETSGIATVVLPKLVSFVSEFDPDGLDRGAVEARSKAAMADSNLDPSVRPSIETFLHAITPGKFTLHTHPVWVNALVSREAWDKGVAESFPDSLLVPYRTPGIELAKALFERLGSDPSRAGSAFLQNHGLICWADSWEDAWAATERICASAAALVGVDDAPARAATEFYKAFRQRGIEVVVHLSNDHDVRAIASAHPDFLSLAPACPDVFVYCGDEIPHIQDASDLGQRIDSGKPPKVFVCGGSVYFVAATIPKAREAEELLRFALLVARANGGQQTRLSSDELEFLGNWESEKWRQQLR